MQRREKEKRKEKKARNNQVSPPLMSPLPSLRNPPSVMDNPTYLKFLNMSLSKLENPLPKRSSGSLGGGAMDCTVFLVAA